MFSNYANCKQYMAAELQSVFQDGNHAAITYAVLKEEFCFTF